MRGYEAKGITRLREIDERFNEIPEQAIIDLWRYYSGLFCGAGWGYISDREIREEMIPWAFETPVETMVRGLGCGSSTDRVDAYSMLVSRVAEVIVCGN